MYWWKKKTPQPPVTATPAQDLESLGPVVRSNHIAYIPYAPLSGVPGVGTANLIYAPDFLLSAPEDYIRGNYMARQANAITICNPPSMVNAPKQVLEGIGGLTAGQIFHQPLLEVNLDNSGVGS